MKSVQSQSLEARLNDSQVTITGIEPIHAYRIVVLRDVSRSALENRAGHGALLALDRLLQDSPAGVSIKYGLFSDKSVFMEDFSSDLDHLHNEASKVTTGFKESFAGGTALFAALDHAIDEFGETHAGDAILAVTDGDNNEKPTSLGPIERRLLKRGIRLFLVLTTRSDHASDEALTLASSARHTGGSVEMIDSNDSHWTGNKVSDSTFQEMQRFWINDVLSGYTITFGSPLSFEKDMRFKLSAGNATNSDVSKAQILYPSHIPSCKEAASPTR